MTCLYGYGFSQCSVTYASDAFSITGTVYHCWRIRGDGTNATAFALMDGGAITNLLNEDELPPNWHLVFRGNSLRVNYRKGMVLIVK